jgi:hypothetical protein
MKGLFALSALGRREGRQIMVTSAAAQRVPAHLWIVGILALLWNAFGCIDYVMTKTENQTYLAKLPADQIAYMHSLPAWVTSVWALGVWGGLAGAILMLMRSRYSVWAFALSFIGAVVGIGYQYLKTVMPASMRTGTMAVMPLVVVLICAFLLWYSWSQDKKGTLR